VANSVQRKGFNRQEIIARRTAASIITVGRVRGPQLLPTAGARNIFGSATLRYPDRDGDAHRARRADAFDREEGVPMMRVALWLLGALLLGASYILRPCCCFRAWRAQDAYAPRHRDRSGQFRHSVPAPHAGKGGQPFNGSRLCRVGLPLRSVARPAEILGADQPSLYVGVVLYPAPTSPYLRHHDRAAGRG